MWLHCIREVFWYWWFSAVFKQLLPMLSKNFKNPWISVAFEHSSAAFLFQKISFFFSWTSRLSTVSCVKSLESLFSSDFGQFLGALHQTKRQKRCETCHLSIRRFQHLPALNHQFMVIHWSSGLGERLSLEFRSQSWSDPHWKFWLTFSDFDHFIQASVWNCWPYSNLGLGLTYTGPSGSDTSRPLIIIRPFEHTRPIKSKLHAASLFDSPTITTLEIPDSSLQWLLSNSEGPEHFEYLSRSLSLLSHGC